VLCFIFQETKHIRVIEITRLTNIITGLVTAVMVLLFTSSAPEKFRFSPKGAVSSVSGSTDEAAAAPSLFNEDIYSAIHEKGR